MKITWTGFSTATCARRPGPPRRTTARCPSTWRTGTGARAFSSSSGAFSSRPPAASISAACTRCPTPTWRAYVVSCAFARPSGGLRVDVCDPFYAAVSRVARDNTTDYDVITRKHYFRWVITPRRRIVINGISRSVRDDRRSRVWRRTALRNGDVTPATRFATRTSRRGFRAGAARTWRHASCATYPFDRTFVAEQLFFSSNPQVVGVDTVLSPKPVHRVIRTALAEEDARARSYLADKSYAETCCQNNTP